MPTAALARPPGAMPGVAVPNMADSVRGGQVAGEMGLAARQADAAALAQIARPEIGGG